MIGVSYPSAADPPVSVHADSVFSGVAFGSGE